VSPEIYSGKRFGIDKANISPNALSVITKLRNSGFSAYLVGGCIRDSIKGMSPKDFDIVTNCQPEQIRKLFKNSRIIGRRFKLVHITFANEVIETTTFRSGLDPADDALQVDDDGRILRDNNWGTQEEDAFRRDFTVNAIYYDPLSKELIDYTSGLKDLKKRKIIFIGDPETRIQEDPVRILRAIRFAAKLNFTIDEQAHEAITKYKSRISEMPPARIYEEIIKLFLSGHAEKSYKLLSDYQVFNVLFPHSKNDAKVFGDFFQRAFYNTDSRHRSDRKLNPGFLFATLLWPKVFEESSINTKLNFRKYYQSVNSVIRRQQMISSIPRRFISFIKDVWMYQIRFNKIGKKSMSFSKNIRYRASFDFLEVRESIEPNLKDRIKWWKEFYESNYDKKIKMLNILRKKSGSR
tara:strand:+ start:204 stop:1427 length:1224 start_codon:yes stop_codon:yes gene_type:complete